MTGEVRGSWGKAPFLPDFSVTESVPAVAVQEADALQGGLVESF